MYYFTSKKILNMKKTFLFVFFSFFFASFVTNLMAQSQIFPVKGAEWYFEHGVGFNYSSGITRYKYQKDTIINSEKYAKLLMKNIFYDAKGIKTAETNRLEFLQQKGSEIKTVSGTSSKLLWKTDLVVGNTFTLTSSNLIDYKIIVNKVGTSKINGKDLKTTWVTCPSVSKVIYDDIAPVDGFFITQCIGAYDCYTPVLCSYKDDIIGEINFKSNGSNCKALTATKDEISNVEFSIFPNPVQNELEISSNYLENATFSIINQNGHILKTISNQDFAKTNNINISDLPHGIYILKMTTKEGNAFKKFVKI